MARFGKKSLERLKGVHPELIVWATTFLALYPEYDFAVVEGLRTKEKQQEYFDKGVSWTMNSKHLKQQDGYSHALDLYPEGWRTFDRDDWDLWARRGLEVAKGMKIGIRSGWVEWGKDAFHFDLVLK